MRTNTILSITEQAITKIKIFFWNKKSKQTMNNLTFHIGYS